MNNAFELVKYYLGKGWVEGTALEQLCYFIDYHQLAPELREFLELAYETREQEFQDVSVYVMTQTDDYGGIWYIESVAVPRSLSEEEAIEQAIDQRWENAPECVVVIGSWNNDG